MPRYFIEVSYKGTLYSGFQVQQNADTIQSEIEKALEIRFRNTFTLTGSSRTDAGVHALQNYFHFDVANELMGEENNGFLSKQLHKKYLYSLNSILPADIVIHNISHVEDKAHARFDATAREYRYQIYQQKNPFVKDAAFFYPYKIDIDKLNQAAEIILNTYDFASFSKRKTQVKNFVCSLYKSEWSAQNNLLVYNIIGNRFLRGMVRGVVGTMLRVGSGKISVRQFEEIIKSKDCTRADFSVPPHGLFLIKVTYPFFL